MSRSEIARQKELSPSDETDLPFALTADRRTTKFGSEELLVLHFFSIPFLPPARFPIPLPPFPVEENRLFFSARAESGTTQTLKSLLITEGTRPAFGAEPTFWKSSRGLGGTQGESCPLHLVEFGRETESELEQRRWPSARVPSRIFRRQPARP